MQTVSIKVGKSNMSDEQVVANVLAALGRAVEHIPKKSVSFYFLLLID
jgi:ribosomal protein L1